MSWRDRWKWQVNHLNEIFLQILQCIIHFDSFFLLFAPQNPDRIVFFGAFLLYYNSSSFLFLFHFATALLPYIHLTDLSLIVFMNITHSTTTTAAVAAIQNTFIMCSQSNRSLWLWQLVWVFLCSFDQWIGNFFIQILFSNYVLAAFNAAFFFFPLRQMRCFSSSFALPSPYHILLRFVLLIHPNTHSLT